MDIDIENSEEKLVKLEHELKSELAKITDFRIDSEKNGPEYIFQGICKRR